MGIESRHEVGKTIKAPDIWRCGGDIIAIILTTQLEVGAPSVGAMRGVVLCPPAHLHPGASAGIRCAGASCWNEVALDIFTTPQTRHSSSVLAPRPFFFLATEGKQMRRNVNSRLLTQHCADKKKAPPQPLRAISCPSCPPAGRTDRWTVSLFHGGQIERPVSLQAGSPTVHTLHSGAPRLGRASFSRNTATSAAHASFAQPPRRELGLDVIRREKQQPSAELHPGVRLYRALLSREKYLR